MSLKLKARIAPRRNEDSDKDSLHTESCMSPPLGIRVFSSTATIRKRRCVRTDAETAFMQTFSPNEMSMFIHHQNIPFEIFMVTCRRRLRSGKLQFEVANEI